MLHNVKFSTTFSQHPRYYRVETGMPLAMHSLDRRTSLKRNI